MEPALTCHCHFATRMMEHTASNDNVYSRTPEEGGPRRTTTCAAELSYLHHLRSCALAVLGAQVRCGCAAGCLPRTKPDWLDTCGAVDVILSLAFNWIGFLTRRAVTFSLLFASIGIARGAYLAYHSSPIIQMLVGPGSVVLTSLLFDRPLRTLCLGAVAHGDLATKGLALLSLGGLSAGFHTARPFCECFFLGVSVLLVRGMCPDLSGCTGSPIYSLVGLHALLAPAFPAAAQGLPMTSWAASVHPTNRTCTCNAAHCKGPIQKGDLRVNNATATRAQPRYCHPGCI